VEEARTVTPMLDISIAIASYGSEEWRQMALDRAYPSAERQGGYEVIVHHEPEGSVASSRNAAAAKATGSFLCQLDADDELAPGFMAAMERAHQPEDLRVLYTPAVSWTRNGHRRPPRIQREMNLEHANWLVIGTLISRELFFEVGGFEDYPHGLEDWNLWAKAWKAGCSIVKVPRAVYIAHYNAESKHHQLQKDRAEYHYWYQVVAHSVFPEIHPAPAPR
jgi:glycosyltransferase involved in cell wall biosynthesis